jgi:heptosyltransferase-2
VGASVTTIDTRSSELLIVSPSWLGDAVMMGALVQRLKAAAPKRRITVLTPAHLEPVVRRLPGVDGALVNPFGHGALKLAQRRAFGRGLKGRFDAAIVLPHSWKSALIPFFAAIPHRVGFVGEARYLLLTDARQLDEKALTRMVDRFALLAEPAGARAPASTPAPALRADPHEVAGALGRLGLTLDRPAVALCVGAEYGPAKRWPTAHFGALARRIVEAGMSAWILGGPSDQAIGAEVQRLSGGGALDLTGKTTLEEAVFLLAAARAVVTNDSGLMHAAAALGRPLVALYGSTSPDFTPPLSPDAEVISLGLSCSPCFERVCPLGHLNCLNELGPGRVWSALRAKLAD